MTIGVLALLTGCLEIHETVTIRADGSGTQAMQMKMSRELLQKLRSQSAAATLQKIDVAAIFDKKKTTTELVNAGLELSQHRVRERRSSHSVAVSARFHNLAELARSPLAGGRADWIVKDGGKGRLALFFFPMGKAAWKGAQARLADFRKTPASARMVAFFRKQKAQMQGLDLVFTLNLPGRVLRTSKNLEIGKSPNQVIARVNTGKINTPEDLIAALAPYFFVEFDGSQCSFGPGARAKIKTRVDRQAR